MSIYGTLVCNTGAVCAVPGNGLPVDAVCSGCTVARNANTTANSVKNLSYSPEDDELWLVFRVVSSTLLYGGGSSRDKPRWSLTRSKQNNLIKHFS